MLSCGAELPCGPPPDALIRSHGQHARAEAGVVQACPCVLGRDLPVRQVLVAAFLSGLLCTATEQQSTKLGCYGLGLP